MRVELDDVACITETRVLLTGENRSTIIPDAVLDRLGRAPSCGLRGVVLHNGDSEALRSKSQYVVRRYRSLRGGSGWNTTFFTS